MKNKSKYDKIKPTVTSFAVGRHVRYIFFTAEPMIKIYLSVFVLLTGVSFAQPLHAQTRPEHTGFRKLIPEAKKSVHSSSPFARVAALKKLPMDAQFYVRNEIANSWTLSSTSKYTYDRAGNKLSSISFTPAGDTMNAQYFTYDSRGYLIDNITRHSNGMKLVNQIRYKSEYDQKGNETLHLEYNWENDKWVLESGRKNFFTYGALGRISEEITQICSTEEVWKNNAKEIYSYGSNSDLYSGLVGFSWTDGEWEKFYELANVIWRDFNEYVVVSADQFEYESGILSYTSRISSVMNGLTLVELYEEMVDGVGVPLERLTHNTNAKGNKISLLEEFADGA